MPNSLFFGAARERETGGGSEKGILFFAKAVCSFIFCSCFPLLFLRGAAHAEVHLRWLWHVEGRGKEEREIIFVPGWMDGWTFGRTNGTRQRTGIRQLLTPLQCVSTRQIYVSMVKDTSASMSLSKRLVDPIPKKPQSPSSFFLPLGCVGGPRRMPLSSSPPQLRVGERNVQIGNEAIHQTETDQEEEEEEEEEVSPHVSEKGTNIAEEE